MALAAPANLGDESRVRALEFAAMRLSVRNLAEFPWIRSAVEAGTLEVQAWFFDLERGELLRVPSDGGPAEVLCAGDEARA